MAQELFDIPKILYFESKNIYSGSHGAFNYKIFPEGQILRVHIWYGVYCMDKSEVLATREFPMTAEGRSEMIDWLSEQLQIFQKSEG